jgi:uncharacterized protein (DUF1684 family)
MSALDSLRVWLEEQTPELEAAGMNLSVTWGTEDRTPRAAWVDFESPPRTARLVLWSNGDADLMIGDIEAGEVLLEEHREITGSVGLDDVGETVRAWLARK